jgi:hypothetical protein
MRDANFRDLYASRLISVEADCTYDAAERVASQLTSL